MLYDYKNTFIVYIDTLISLYIEYENVIISILIRSYVDKFGNPGLLQM